MRIMGVDHGAMSGISLLEDDRLILTASFKSTGDTLESLVCNYKSNLTVFIEFYKPDVIVLEYPSDMKNAKTSRQLIGMFCAGAIVADNFKIPQFSYPPKTVRKVILGKGHGNAKKPEVYKFLKQHFKCSREELCVDEYYKRKEGIKSTAYDMSDAVALALCHYMKGE